MSGVVLHLLRHGAPETAGLMLGHCDALPTPGGIAACAKRAADLPVKAIVTSDLARAARAAEAIAHAAAAPLSMDPRWRELDFGSWDGKPPHEIDRQALARFWDDPDGDPPPHGERWSALVACVGAALRDISERSTLVVTHGGAMRAALTVLCGLDHRQSWVCDLPYAALLSLRVWPGERPTGQIVSLRT